MAVVSILCMCYQHTLKLNVCLPTSVSGSAATPRHKRSIDVQNPAPTFELQAGSGRCYLSWPGRTFARRWYEAAFIPLIAPSNVVLRTVLATAKATK